MAGFLHRVVSRTSLVGASGAKGGQTGSSPYHLSPNRTSSGDALRAALGRVATLDPPAEENDPDHETFVFGLGLGMPFFASTPERLVTFLARHDIDRTLHLLMPPETRREISCGERGYYCRVLVPVPNDLPDRIPVM